ncbi:hypothetical protein N7U66_20510 [Lacinutrix neustonica]|uniref:Uncharacterized protein n=1 Tax=Lacinutrix neustonica TaxID=2980107 RepID=A0A9E8MVH5_9FLAO|nr:hypothetical protein [Lacinutrix neustonica]WAC02126.1 hypothetical protein N7U66_20510 [Lacinutrix neustonica]
MNIKIVLLFVFTLIYLSGFSQEIKLIEGIAYIDNAKYISLEKTNKKKYIIGNTDTKEEILKIELFKSYNTIDKRTHKLPRVFFIRINETMEFESDIQSEIELVRFLYKNKIVFFDGKPNEKKVFDYLEYLKNYRN